MPQSSDIQMLRLLLSQQQNPIQLQSVNDVGGGIAMGINNIMNVLTQRRQNQQLAQMLAAQQQAEQEAFNQKVTALQGMGLSPEQAMVAAYDDEMGRQIQKQAHEDQENTKNFKSYFDAYRANGLSVADAQIAANSAIFGARAPVGAETLVGQGIALHNLVNPEVSRILDKSRMQQITPEEQAVLNALGVKAPTFREEQQAAANLGKSVNDIRYGNANIGLKEDELGRAQSVQALIQKYNQDGDINAFMAGAAALQDNPVASTQNIIGKDKVFNKPEAIPSPTPPPQQAPQQAPKLQPFNVQAGQIGTALNPNLNINPMQRGQMLGQGLGNTLQGGMQSLGQGMANTSRFLQGTGLFQLPKVNELGY